MFGAVDVVFLVVVLIAGGEGEAGVCVSRQGTLQIANGGGTLDVERVLGLFSTQTEGGTQGLWVVPPVGELDLEDVVPVFGHRVGLLQTQPELS